MRPGVGWIVAGVVLLAAAIVVTVWSGAILWYGGMIVGVVWIVRGVLRLSKAPPREPPPPTAL